jgi:peptidoglycan/LPS O-acetylase OafA/YrhL
MNEPVEGRPTGGFAIAGLLAFAAIYSGSTAIDLLRGADPGAWIVAGLCVGAGLVAGWMFVRWGRARRDRPPRVAVVVGVALIAFLVLESIALWASDTVNARTNALIVGICIAVLVGTLPEAIRSAVSDRRDRRQRLRTPPPMPGP